jgi:hypothetical protein
MRDLPSAATALCCAVREPRLHCCQSPPPSPPPGQRRSRHSAINTPVLSCSSLRLIRACCQLPRCAALTACPGPLRCDLRPFRSATALNMHHACSISQPDCRFCPAANGPFVACGNDPRVIPASACRLYRKDVVGKPVPACCSQGLDGLGIRVVRWGSEGTPP